MRSIATILLLSGFSLGARAEEGKVLRTSQVPIHGIPAHLEVVAREYELSREQVADLQARKERFEPAPPPLVTLDPIKFQPIPGIPDGETKTATPRPTFRREKLSLLYRDELVGEIPGNPRYGAQLSGWDHGFRDPVVEKVIAIGERRLVIIVAEKGWGGTELDRVYLATREAKNSWTLAQVPLGGTTPPLRGPSFDHEPLRED